MANEPKTLQEAVLYFNDPDNCISYLVARRWPNGVICPNCGSTKVSYLESVRRWQCSSHHDQRQFTLKTGTIMEDSPIRIDKWMIAMWLVLNCKNGISSYEIGRALGMSQKSAWHLMHRVRYALHGGPVGKLSGQVEADETLIGGKSRNMHREKRARKITGTGGKDKIAVMGMVERGGNVRAFVTGTRKKKDLQPLIREHVEAGAAIFSDELKSYDGLESDYQHAVINHAVEYVNGNVHTNTMENFWSLLKRGLHGTYISVEPYHLFRYIDEQAYRYNNRKLTDSERFDLAVRQIVGKRLTWDSLTGKEPDHPASLIN
jgi:transposase-like protein